MKLLAFDTSTAACTVALVKNNTEPCFEHHQILPMQQGRLILPTIEALLAEAGIKLNELDAIAYGCGPGSFTGIRIASSVAQGLGLGASCPLIPISSLAALAQTVYMSKQWPNLLVAVNAHMGEIYWSSYQANDGIVQLVSKEAIASPSQVSQPTSAINWHGVGDGWRIYRDTLIKSVGVEPMAIDSEQLPMAKAILTLAINKYNNQEWVKPHDAVPVYLR